MYLPFFVLLHALCKSSTRSLPVQGLPLKLRVTWQLGVLTIGKYSAVLISCWVTVQIAVHYVQIKEKARSLYASMNTIKRELNSYNYSLTRAGIQVLRHFNMPAQYILDFQSQRIAGGGFTMGDKSLFWGLFKVLKPGNNPFAVCMG